MPRSTTHTPRTMCLLASAGWLFCSNTLAQTSAPVAPLASSATPAQASACPAILKHSFNRLQDETPQDLCQYAGKVILMVNTASYCGFTGQYEGLEALYRQFKDQGLVVMGFPANNFRGQEPGDNAEIAEFCSVNYDVTFPMFSKISVAGEDKHPLYAELITEAPPAVGDKEAHRARLRDYGIETTEDPEVVWNFEKFLVSRDGEVVGRFAPQLMPDSPEIVEAIERELTK